MNAPLQDVSVDERTEGRRARAVRLACAVILILAVGQAVGAVLALASLRGVAAAHAVTSSAAQRAAAAEPQDGAAPPVAAPETSRAQRYALEHPFVVMGFALAVAGGLAALHLSSRRCSRAAIAGALFLISGRAAVSVAIWDELTTNLIGPAIAVVLLLRGWLAAGRSAAPE